VAIGDLTNINLLADELTPTQQVELAEYLSSKTELGNVSEEASLSEAVMAKDWLRPEEDLAWANLQLATSSLSQSRFRS